MRKLFRISILFTLITLVASACTKTNIVSPENVNGDVKSFVTTYFSEANIASAFQDGREWEVTLSDGTQIDFDRKLQWEEIDCQYSTIYQEVPSVFIPQQIITYVEDNYSTNYIRKISKDRTSWDIELNNGLDIEFNKSFVVVEIG